jgi:Ca2+-binding EF-hand superfamily protein
VAERFDVNGDGKITFAEFQRWVYPPRDVVDLKNEIAVHLNKYMHQHNLTRRAIFGRIDMDGNGKVGKREMQDGLQNLGFLLMDQEFHALMDVVDINGDGVLSYEEWLVHFFGMHAVEAAEENAPLSSKSPALNPKAGAGYIVEATSNYVRREMIEHFDTRLGG